MSVKTKNAAFPQRFIISGATINNGTYEGVTGTDSVDVDGSQWTITMQHDPGTGFQLSDTKLKSPNRIGGNYQFDIQSNDSGNDTDFDDLVLTCRRSATPNDFIIYGNLSLYSGLCIFNSCRRDLFVIETSEALKKALKNSSLRDVIENLYPERVPSFKLDPPLPEPPYFKPVVIDLFGEAMKSKTTLNVGRLADDSNSGKSKTKGASLSQGKFKVEEAISNRNIASESMFATNRYEIARAIDGFYRSCEVEPGSGVTLTFEEYDRTISEQAGGPYTGTGNRRLLGDTITDMFGNYIFLFSFDMTFPILEDETDDFPGQTASTYAYPDVIVKVTGGTSWDVLYESAPYYNIPNLKRINLCLPKSKVRVTSSCANGNLIGSIGDVFLGGNQNTTASTSAVNLRRDGYSNYLKENGVITVDSTQAGFKVQCAAWRGMIDIKGCIYDDTKSLSENEIRWYTIRIARKPTSGPPAWTYVTENYKHPLFHKRNDPGYQGDVVGPYPTTIEGVPDTMAYKNIRYEVHRGEDPIDWVNDDIDRLMQLHTGLYDIVGGLHEPGTFYLRIDGYDEDGNHVSGKTDMIALYIHNRGINFGLTTPTLTDPAIVDAGCQLFRLTDGQKNTPMEFSFMANDPYGFLDRYSLSMSRCPDPTIALEADPMADTSAGDLVLAGGNSTSIRNNCVGYSGTLDEFGNSGLIATTLEPLNKAIGWVNLLEDFTVYSFGLTARQRVTNGKNSGLDEHSPAHGQIMMQRLNP